MTIQAYISTLNQRYQTGIGREHTYRGDLQSLLMAILPDILVTNEPVRVTQTSFIKKRRNRQLHYAISSRWR